MTPQSQTRSLGGLVVFAICLTLSVYFTFAAMQGDYGLFRRIEIEAEIRRLDAERMGLDDEVARMENLTHRLSDAYLDLDLLDERARDVLGLLRYNEIVIE
ncbi:MAG: septum formation initiator family protein [Pseudomonadota bacterium]